MNALARRADTLSLGDYRLDEFNTFYAALIAMCAAHDFLCFRWGQIAGAYPIESAVMVRRATEWRDLLSGLSGICAAKCAAMLSDLTFSVRQAVDLHVYPVIPLDARNETLAVAPPFPLHSRHDENILRVCSQRRQTIYDATSLEKEEGMRARLRDAGRRYGADGPFGLPDPLPDIDLLAADDTSSTVVVAELKWSRKPLKPAEAVDRDLEVLKGVQQLDAIREFLTRTPDHLSMQGRLRRPLGDFIDRGPAQVRSVDIARRMVDADVAIAVMGNHELNAIAWHTPDPRYPGEYLRSRDSATWGVKNRKQHAAFLAEVEDQPALHSEIIDWFLTLPLWVDLPALHVVHACWHHSFISWLAPRLHRGRYLTRELMVPATDEPENEEEKDNDTPSIFKAVECLTKGIEVPLPAGHQFRDKDGIVRNRVRVSWWDESADTFRKAAMLSHEEREALPDEPLPMHARVSAASKPVFFGHYWLTGSPSLQSRRAACLDYSAGKGGPLVAYRFDSEPELVPEHFVWVK